MRTGRPKADLIVTEEERERLQQWARRPKSSQALAQRSRIVLECAAGKNNQEVARELGVKPQTVGKWRGRFVAKRLDGLLDEPRPGTGQRLSDREVERVLTMTLEKTPRDATHWSTRSMAKASGLSHSSVSRIWRAFALAPHTAARHSNYPKIRCSS